MLHTNRLGSIGRSRLSAAMTPAGSAVLHSCAGFALTPDEQQEIEPRPDYSLTIATQPIELAPNRIGSVTAYNGQFPARFCASSKSHKVPGWVRQHPRIAVLAHIA